MNATRYEFTTRTAIHLKTKHGEVNVHQSCSEYIIARHPINIPPGEATLVLAIDDKSDGCRVYLPEGIRVGEEVHRIVMLDEFRE